MTPLVIPYPQIDPVLLHIYGPIAIRWYALAYIVGLVLGWHYILRMLRNGRLWQGAGPPASRSDIDDLLLWATIGVVLGGRLGYLLFYGLVYDAGTYLEHPVRLFAIWQGGMSFHGGLLGVALAIVFFCRARKLDMLRVGDLVAAAVPIGLFFGRVANFINGELYGRPSTVAWAMVFPADPAGLPRHPSQLYEASLEGIALFVVLRLLTHHSRALARPGLVTGAFLIGYGIFRTMAEFFRDPENLVGGGVTMGMLLSVPMWSIGLWLVWRAYKQSDGAQITEPPASAEPPPSDRSTASSS